MTSFTPEPNLKNLHWAMQHDPDGRPEIRVAARAGSDAPLHVSVDDFSSGATIYTSPADGPSHTAFSRQRFATTRLLGEFRNFYGTTGNVEMISNTAVVQVPYARPASTILTYLEPASWQ